MEEGGGEREEEEQEEEEEEKRRRLEPWLPLSPPLLCISPHPTPAPLRSRIASFQRGEDLLLVLAFADTALEATPGGACREH